MCHIYNCLERDNLSLRERMPGPYFRGSTGQDLWFGFALPHLPAQLCRRPLHRGDCCTGRGKALCVGTPSMSPPTPNTQSSCIASWEGCCAELHLQHWTWKEMLSHCVFWTREEKNPESRFALFFHLYSAWGYPIARGNLTGEYGGIESKCGGGTWG